MRTIIEAVLSCIVLLAGSPARAQEAMSSAEDGPADLAIVLEGMTLGAAPTDWTILRLDAARDEIVDALGIAGWAPDVVAARLAEGDYDLYTKPVGPGVAAYLAVAQAPDGTVTEFPPYIGAAAVQPGWTAEDIRVEIIEGMQASIVALCAMPARPAEIRAQASAFGVLEIEAIWDAAEVCEVL